MDYQETLNTYFPKEFIPSKIGKKRKVILKKGDSISTKWKKRNEFIIRYKPNNRADFYSPYFLFEFKDGKIIRTIPFPNLNSFIYTIIFLIVLNILKIIPFEFMIYGFGIIYTIILQIAVGIGCLKKIKTIVFGMNNMREKTKANTV